MACQSCRVTRDNLISKLENWVVDYNRQSGLPGDYSIHEDSDGTLVFQAKDALLRNIDGYFDEGFNLFDVNDSLKFLMENTPGWKGYKSDSGEIRFVPDK